MVKGICNRKCFAGFDCLFVSSGNDHRAIALRRKSGGGEEPYCKNHCHK